MSRANRVKRTFKRQAKAVQRLFRCDADVLRAEFNQAPLTTRMLAALKIVLGRL